MEGAFSGAFWYRVRSSLGAFSQIPPHTIFDPNFVRGNMAGAFGAFSRKICGMKKWL